MTPRARPELVSLWISDDECAARPGRRIATLGDSAGLAPKLAFVDPEPAGPVPLS
jgi:hypothetical protein